ncbi:MAG TPA: efflux RND transporter permease subunit [Bacteroidales bacterium]|nr:efflux RND transporter permease subunit [Bacteroidales bacterium]HPR73949.1 efflux RND transporter permease subunit [Bacteroidales bacterium]
MSSEPHYSSFLSTFTVNIFFVMLIIVGAAMIPLLSLQLNPTRNLPSVTISWSWPEAPVRVVEQEVTTTLEGILSTVTGIKQISSSTMDAGGSITVEFDKNTDLRAKRFEVASLLRDVRERLPERVSYPVISMNMPSNQSGSTILSFQLNGNASPAYIFNMAEEVIKPKIALVEGVYSVSIYGATPQEWEVTYDQGKIAAMDINPSAINSAIEDYRLKRELGGAYELMAGGNAKRTYLILRGNKSEDFRWDDIPVAKVSGRIIHLTDVAQIKLKDQRPQSYYRINGLNTININVSAGRNVNNIKVAGEVNAVIANIKKELPPGYSIRTSMDNTVYLKEEITRNIFRSVLSVVLLLLLVLLISREFKYLLIITISLVANILIAFIFYYLFKLEIHLYSLAGITVSFGIIINNTIVMTDHIRYQKNRKVGISLVAATLTTIGALVVIFFLDEASKVTLADFAAVVIINLSVSLLVALFFIPGLTDKIKLRQKFNSSIIKRKRRVVRLSDRYLKCIDFISKYRVTFIIAALLIFGLPVFYLPDSLPDDTGTQTSEEDLTKFQKFYNKTLGNRKYVQDVKPVVNKVLGGTFRLFNEKAKNSRFYYYGGSDEVRRTRLTVNIGLSEEGLTIEDLNNTCSGLENMLAAYNEIDMFTTNIYSAEEASLSITFKPEHDLTIFPFILKIRIEDYMNGIGSYHASVSGVGKAFSNQVYSDYITTSYSVIMRGYNYDALYAYSEDVRERLIESGKGRIKDVYLLGANYSGYIIGSRNRKVYRNRLGMDKFYLAENNSDVAFAYNEARKYSRGTTTLQSAYIGGTNAPVNIRSRQSELYDYWILNNTPLKTSSGQFVKLKDFSSVTREVSDNTIRREDQQYVITVGYDFVGNAELGRLILERNIDETNAMLPLGYTARDGRYRYSWEEGKANYHLLFLVILIIYFICSILLESFKQPFVVISLIPFSFIGVFITFHVFNITVDEGVFAAMILLCGIVVNSTLYILNDYNSLRRRRPSLPLNIVYVKAFNNKIIPILLTLMATIVGLIPFLLTGRDERFWFALAAATISGLVFSLAGLVVYQPIMLKKSLLNYD